MYRVKATWDRGYAVPKYVAKCPHPVGQGLRCGHDNAVDEKTERLTCRCNSEITVWHELPVELSESSDASRAEVIIEALSAVASDPVTASVMTNRGKA